MADGDSGDSGTGGTNSSDDSLATGYGSGSEFSGNSETGVLSSPDVAASYSNTGAEGSLPVDTSGDAQRSIQRDYNQKIKGGAFTPLPGLAAPSAAQASFSSPSGYPSSTQKMMPQGQTEQPQEQEKPDQKEKSSLPGQGGNPPLVTKGPAPYNDHRAVQRNPFPFSPVQPIAGSGVKKAFFDQQNDLLKTMLPYWNK